MLPNESEMKPFRVVRADEVGVKGTFLESMIRESHCIICGDWADREVWIYSNNGGENSNNKVKNKNFACSPECSEFIAWRTV